MNKILFASILAIFLLISFVSADNEQFESYETQDNSHNMDGATPMIAQGITIINKTVTISNISLYLNDNLGANGPNITVIIRSTNNATGTPIGTNLSQGSVIVPNGFGSGSYLWLNISMSSYDLYNQTNYTFVILTNDTGGLRVGIHYTNPTYAYGNASTSATGADASWTLQPFDIDFRLYGTATSGVESSLLTNITNPSNNSKVFNSQVNFTADYSFSGDVTIKNGTYYLWNYSSNTLVNSTTKTISSARNVTSLNISGIGYGNYLWNVYACGENATGVFCRWGKEGNYSFSRNLFNETGISYNTTTYESSYETITLNLSIEETGYSISSASLVYNGTSYTSTVTCSGENCSLKNSFNLPLITGIENNNSFYWNINFGSLTQITSSYGQNVSRIFFTRCNSTYPTPYLNFSFRDELSSLILNASVPYSSVTYWLGTGSVNKTYTFTNSSEERSYGLCFYPQDRRINANVLFQYKNDTCPQRTYQIGNTYYTNSSTNVVLYLLSTNDGQYVTFQVINVAEQPIEDVFANVSRTISGTQTVISTGYTSADGGITFWLNPDFLHSLVFQKSGYDDYITSLYPTQTSYTVTLGGGTSGATQDYLRGINYEIQPKTRFVYNDTTYNFNFTVTTNNWEISEFGFSLYLDNGTILGSTSASTNGGTVNLNQNTINLTKINMNYYWVINGNYTNGTSYWIVLESGGTGYSIRNFFTRLTTYLNSGLFGATSFALSLIIFILILTFTGIMSYKFGITSPAAISITIFVLVLLFDVGLNLLPTPLDSSIPYFPTILVGIIMIGILIREGIK